MRCTDTGRRTRAPARGRHLVLLQNGTVSRCLAVPVLCTSGCMKDKLAQAMRTRLRSAHLEALTAARMSWLPALERGTDFVLRARRMTSCPSAQNDIVSAHMTNSTFWEHKLAEAMLARLDEARAEALDAGRRTPIFLDIGANVGSYSLSAAAHGHRVLACEPLTLNTVALRRSLCRNAPLAPLVTLHEKALAGAEREGCVIVTADQNVGDGTVKCGMPPGWVPGAGAAVRPGAHEFVRLDDFLCARDISDIVFAKLDVEVRSAGLRPCADLLLRVCACVVTPAASMHGLICCSTHALGDWVTPVTATPAVSVSTKSTEGKSQASPWRPAALLSLWLPA